MFRVVVLELKHKNIPQILLRNKTIEILKKLDNVHQQALILEKFDIRVKHQKKKRKVERELNSIQVALIFKKFKFLRVLLDKIDQRKYLENYELLNQAVMSRDDDQLQRVLDLYKIYDVPLAHRPDKTSWNQDTIEALTPYMKSCIILSEQNKAKMFAFVCYNTFIRETARHKMRDGAEEEADCIFNGKMSF